ncbi:DNA-processing protein DprA [Bacillus sp. REN3]|uniref:DNA-processing protein DprA n=1 Tax=Bacillus sp. REN3 TaxID=2802440 RepID=UPI001AEF2AC4|nr:DNA-processing protein DprA [Bacillus sp. REN3]
MDEATKRLIHLVHSTQSWKTIYSIIKTDPLLEHIYKAPYHSPLFPQASSTLDNLHTIPIDKLLAEYASSDIQLISIFNPAYPERLKTIYQPPWILFAKGNTALLKCNRMLAIVGSRDATQYGRRTIEYLMPGLIENGLMIISGLAKGIDAHSHKEAIKQGGKTAAVIAGGFNHIYPRENLALASYMMEKQLVISEYPPGSRPEKWQFPMRNRIISGLSLGTLVVEARKKSGSLITADYALNEGREVFAIPGDILSPHSEGCHDLILQGAKLVKSPSEILEELNIYNEKTRCEC